MTSKQITTKTFPEVLKENTLVPHQELENLPISRAIVSPDLTMAQYIDYLSVMHGIMLDVEENIAPRLKDIITDLPERNKAGLISNDLNALGINLPAETKKPFTDKNAEITPAFALGIMYVTEGSTLGGRFILKNIKDTLGYDEEGGASFFAGYGNKTGSMQKSFMQMLTQHQQQTGTDEEIIAGANFAFNAIKNQFTENSSNQIL